MSGYHYGGQAVLEGVMMRGEHHAVTAVRGPDKQIVTQAEALDSPLYNSRWAKMPFLRGLVMMYDTLSLGYRSLMFSANVQLGEEEESFGGGTMLGTMAVSLLFVVGVFFLLPMFLVGLVDQHIASDAVSTLLEGLVRVGLFLAYLWGISFMPDIRRVFAYHGAEHKTVNAQEAGAPLEVSEVQAFSTAHTRCGTSFLLVVMVLFVLITVLLGRPPLWLRLLSRIVLIPVVAGISYEWLKFSASHYDHPIVRAMAAPGLAIQRFSTREPEDDMVEVAIVALREVMAADAQAEAAPAA